MHLADSADLVAGVDTHLDTHTAAICDARGRALAQLQVPATTAGYAQLLAWARSAAGDAQVIWAVEGTRHYGLGLARHLAGESQQVTEIDSSHHLGKRKAGKSGLIDAVRAARELLACPHPAQMRCDGDREALRLLMTDRDNAVQSAKTARTALAAILVTAPAPLRERLRPLPRERRAKECAALTCPPGAGRQTRVLHQTLIRLGQRIAALYLPAAQILLPWSHAGRIRSEQAFAMLSGTAPIPVSSGREIRRCIKRYLARHLYLVLTGQPNSCALAS